MNYKPDRGYSHMRAATKLLIALACVLVLATHLSDDAVAQMPPPARACCAAYVRCMLPAPTFPGQSCFCVGPYGPIPGYACY